RCAATVTNAVSVVTHLYLLRLRHQLHYRRRTTERSLMAEETFVVAIEGRANPSWLPPEDIPALLQARPVANLPEETAKAAITEALDQFKKLEAKIADIAQERAAALHDDHRRVREAAK